jgi:hypothetical protein
MDEELHTLKKKRARERSNITRFSSSIHSFTEETARDYFEHYKGRLEEALDHMLKLDDTSRPPHRRRIRRGRDDL